MYRSNILSFHFENPQKKLSKSWAYEAIQSLYYNTGRKNLLYGKNVAEIEGYSSGNIDMREFKMMYKSIADKINQTVGDEFINTGNVEKYMQFNPYPLIPSKLNSAIAIMQKVPFEIMVKALDGLAIIKKKEDLAFIKNKPKVEAELQGLAELLGAGDVDLGTTKHSSIPYGSSPHGLDLNEPDEEQVFVDFLYSLMVESSFETVLQIFYEIKALIQLRYLECRDQLKWGVSVNNAFESDLTGLPDARYIYPGSMEVPYSDLLDMSDRTHEFENMRPTVIELFNMFGSEIPDLKTLETIINGEFGYCQGNKMGSVPERNWATFKTNLIYCKVKSVDWVGVRSTVNADGDLDYEFTMEEEEASEKIWAQNTYTFYWLKNTKHIFKVDKLGYAHRKEGQEQYQGFDTSIYRSQIKSAVEQSIGENKKAQVASIKIEHCLIKSLPPGKVIDLKGMRSALQGALKDESNEFGMMKLITMAVEENIILIDTEGFDGKNDGQLKPFYEIPGGLHNEISGYINIIREANANIEQFTGINSQLTGTSQNPDTLIGLEKLRLSSGINALYYIQEGLTSQYQKLMNIWASIIKKAVEAGGKRKEAIVNLIGKEKTSIIDGLSELPLHSMGVKISLTQRELERSEYEQEVKTLSLLGVLTVADKYMLSAISNPKDKIRYLAVKEKQFKKKQTEEQKRKFAEQQQLMQQQGQNQVQVEAAATDGKIKEVYAKGEVQGKILSLANQLGLSEIQMDGLVKRALQRDRGIDQERKAVSTIKAKSDAEATKAFV